MPTAWKQIGSTHDSRRWVLRFGICCKLLCIEMWRCSYALKCGDVAKRQVQFLSWKPPNTSISSPLLGFLVLSHSMMPMLWGCSGPRRTGALPNYSMMSVYQHALDTGSSHWTTALCGTTPQLLHNCPCFGKGFPNLPQLSMNTHIQLRILFLTIAGPQSAVEKLPHIDLSFWGPLQAWWCPHASLMGEPAVLGVHPTSVHEHFRHLLRLRYEGLHRCEEAFPESPLWLHHRHWSLQWESEHKKTLCDGIPFPHNLGRALLHPASSCFGTCCQAAGNDFSIDLVASGRCRYLDPTTHWL